MSVEGTNIRSAGISRSAQLAQGQLRRSSQRNGNKTSEIRSQHTEADSKLKGMCEKRFFLAKILVTTTR